MIDCGWCDGEGAADWLYDVNGNANALESVTRDEIATAVIAGGKVVRGEECEECHGTGELFEDEDGNFDWVGALFAYEAGGMDMRDVLLLFAHLIKTGSCWSLQGSYGRAARRFIEAELIDDEGQILWDTVTERIVE